MSNKINYIHTTDTHNTKAAEAFIPMLFEQIGVPTSVVDVGCGIGTWLCVFKEKGIKNILGIDGDNVDPKLMQIEQHEFRIHDLSKTLQLNTHYDLALCLEVAEHLPEAYSDVLVGTLCKLADRILFSAALPSQGGQNHCNEQPFEYWKSKFNQKGYVFKDVFRSKIWNDTRIDCWYRQNMFLIEKVDDKPISQELIHDYYHPEIYLTRHAAYVKAIAEKSKIKEGDIHVSSSFKIFIKSLLIYFKVKL